MAMLVALYPIALLLSIGFFLWAVYSFLTRRRIPDKRNPGMAVGPDNEPAIVALYCQYLIAPQKALWEAQQALLASASGRHTAGKVEKLNDFFEVLALLETRSTAPLRRGS